MRKLFRCLLPILGMTLLALALVARRGLPERLREAVLDRVRLGVFSIEAARARLSWHGALELEDVRLYRRFRPGPPVAEARAVMLRVTPLAWFGHDTGLRHMEIRDGVARPEMLSGPPAAPRAGRPAARLQCRVDLLRIECQGVLIEKGAADVRAGDGVLRIERLRMHARNGERAGRVSGWINHNFATGVSTAELETLADPVLFEPVLLAWDAPILASVARRFEFLPAAPPRVRATFVTSGSATGRVFELNAETRLPACRYLDVPVEAAEARVGVRLGPTVSQLTISPLTITRPEGQGRGGLTFDFKADEIAFDGHSTLEPDALFQLLQLPADTVAAVRRHVQPEPPCDVRAWGRFNYADMDRTAFQGTVRTAALRVFELPVTNVSAAFDMRGWTNRVTGLRGGLYDGPVQADLLLSPRATTNGAVAAYALNAVWTAADFRQVIEFMRGATGSQEVGRMDLELAIEGTMTPDALTNMTGHGAIKVRDGRVFNLPLFGGLSDFMRRAVPGLDFVLRQSDADAEFTIANGRVASDKVRIQGDVLSLVAVGSMGFDTTLDFEAQVKLMKEHTLVAKVLRFVTWPISKLLEFRLRGPVRKPEWYPINFSRELLERLHILNERPGQAP